VVAVPRISFHQAEQGVFMEGQGIVQIRRIAIRIAIAIALAFEQRWILSKDAKEVVGELVVEILGRRIVNDGGDPQLKKFSGNRD